MGRLESGMTRSPTRPIMISSGSGVPECPPAPSALIPVVAVPVTITGTSPSAGAWPRTVRIGRWAGPDLFG